MASPIERFKEFLIENRNLIVTGFVAPVITGLVVVRCQQSIFESSGVIKPEDRIAVIECRRRLNNKGFIELESLCSPLENNFLKSADHETYEVVGKLVHKKNWHQNGKETDRYTGEMIRKEKICPQLKEIDELWKKVSIRLGFSAQRKIWKESHEDYPTFTEKVGWVINESTWVRNLSYELKIQKTSKNGQLENEDIKEGHLPALWNQTVKEPTEGPSSGEDDYKAFFKALQFCKIGDELIVSTDK